MMARNDVSMLTKKWRIASPNKFLYKLHLVQCSGAGKIHRHRQVVSTSLEECGTRLELLDDHACGREHGEAAVLELLRLHLLELFGVLGLEAGRVEVEVARDVPRTELEIVLRHGRLHPTAERTEGLGHRDEEEYDGPEALGHLPELVDGNTIDLAPEERRGARLANEEAEGCEHGHTAVRELGLAVALELRRRHTLGEARGIEEARGFEDAGERLDIREVRCGRWSRITYCQGT